MTSAADWISAFPLQQANAAVDALRQGWLDLAAIHKRDFNPKTKEDSLTKKLKIYIENYVARERALLGYWAAEDIIGEIDPVTATLVEERRTDITYSWNNDIGGIKLVFEFKRLGRQKKHRDHYLRDRGLGRFVTGIYSRQEAVAAMVGILLDPAEEVVPPIKAALSDSNLAALLRLRPAPSGGPYIVPSSLFADAEFDTEHDRDPHLAPTHGFIRVAHFFLAFGYPTSTTIEHRAGVVAINIPK